jgi:hypothetical protein
VKKTEEEEDPDTANCIIIDLFSAFEPGLVALFLTLRDKNGWVRAKTARILNLGVSRNCFGDFLADPDSRSFSRFGAIIMHCSCYAPSPRRELLLPLTAPSPSAFVARRRMYKGFAETLYKKLKPLPGTQQPA